MPNVQCNSVIDKIQAVQMNEKIYLFKGTNLAVPEVTPDAEAARGVDLSAARAAFGELPWYAVPAVCGDDPSPRGVLLDENAALPSLWRLLPVREALFTLAGEEALPAGTAGAASAFLRLYHILQWREESRFCGSCAERNGDSPEELARLCPRCGRLEYPRISPAVIILVTNDRGEALLAHNRKFRDKMYSLIAGFAEAGESLEAAAVRELREEVNIEVKDLRYAASQAWPFPNSLMVGFTARYASGDLKPDGREILDAQWFSAESARRGVPELPGLGSIARRIIGTWLESAP
jgi:NAD+ diphosphatase